MMRSKRKQKIIKHKKLHESFLRLWIFFLTVFLLFLFWRQKRLLYAFSNFGYLGVFFINFFSSATIVPVLGPMSVLMGGAIWQPLFIGMISSFGSSLAEVFSYFLGYGGKGITALPHFSVSWIKKIEKYFKKSGFLTVFLFAFLPFPLFDAIGIVAGIADYPLWKFVSAIFLGRVFRNVLLALAGHKLAAVHLL